MKPITVVAGLISKDGRILICQRKPSGAFPGKWEFPGGKVEPGEEPRAALQRELAEELGIAATIGEEIWRIEHQYPDHAPVALFFFSVTEYEGTPQNRAFQDMLWAQPPELLHYDFLEADRALIARIAAGELSPPRS